MHRSFLTLLLAAFILCIPSREKTTAEALQNDSTHNLAGSWKGILSTPSGALTLVFNFTPNEGGGYTLTLDSPDQGAYGIVADSVDIRDSRIQIFVRSIRGAYKGTLLAEADSISGTWNQSGLSLPVGLKHEEKVASGPKRPQEPKKPYPYMEKDVTFINAEAVITLAGTLTFPSDGKPHTGVILISGSGPQERDGTVFGHKLFLVLADYLTRHGIAVLRFDDRGTGKSTGKFNDATSRDFAGDVKSAIAFLKTRKEISKNKIGLVGHSEGGLIAPMVAVESKDVAFIVMMAGPGVPGDEIIVRQSELIMRAQGVNENEVMKQRDLNRKAFDIVKFGKDSATISSQLRSFILLAMDSTYRKDTVAAEAKIKEQIEQMTSPWLRYFISYDPRTALKKVRCPVLAINGEKDLQVSPDQNLPEVEAALQAGGNKDYTIRKLPGLNHLFQTAIKGSPEEYSTIEETLSPVALRLISDWILERSR